MTQLIETALLIELLESWIGEVRITRSRRTPTRIRLKRRRYYRRHKSQIKRKQRRYRRKPRTRRLAKRRTKIKKRLHIRPGSRRRVRVAGLDIAANIFETSRGDRMGKDINSELKALQLELSQSPSEDLAIAFGKAKRLAEALDRKYGAVLESRNFKKKSKPLYEEREEVQVSDMEMDLDPLRFLPEHKEETLLSEEGFDELLLSGPKGSKELSEAVDTVKSDLAILAEDAKTMADLMRKGGADEVEARDILVQMVEYLDVAMESALVEEESEYDDEDFFTIYFKKPITDKELQGWSDSIEGSYGVMTSVMGDDGINVYTKDKELLKKIVHNSIGMEHIEEVPGLDETVEFGNRIGNELPKNDVTEEKALSQIIKDFKRELEDHEEEIAVDSDLISDIAKSYQDNYPKINGLYNKLMQAAGYATDEAKITEDAKDITGGFAIGTSDEHLIKENAAEKGIELGQKEWDTLNDDFGKVERNAMEYLKKEHGITTRDEGHDSSGDLIGTFWAPKDKAEFLEDHSEKNEPLRTSSGTLNSDILWKGVSEIGQSLIDVDIHFFGIESGENDLHEDSGKDRFEQKLEANKGAEKSVVQRASKAANQGSNYDRIIGIAKSIGDTSIVKHVEALKSIQDELGYKPNGMDQLMDEFGVKLLFRLVMDHDWTREQVQQVSWGLPLSGLKMYGLDDLRGGGDTEEKATESVNEASEGEDLNPGDIFKVTNKKGDHYGLVVANDRHERSDSTHFYYANTDKSGKIVPNSRVSSSNMLLGDETQKVGSKKLKSKSAHGKTWYLTGNKAIDTMQLPNLDVRYTLWQEYAPQELQDLYAEQEDQNYHSENSEMVNAFANHLANNQDPKAFTVQKGESLKEEESGKTISKYEIEDIGMEHSQYFQGRGTSGTDWDMVYVGIGNNQKDAIDDALEAVAEDGWEISSELNAEHAKADDKNNILTKMYVRFKESTDGKPFIELIDINSEGELGEPQGASLHKGAIEASGLNAEDVAEEIISALEDAGHKLSNSDKKELEDAGRRANESELHYHVAIYVKGDGNKKEDEDITTPSPTSQMGMSGGASDMSGAIGESEVSDSDKQSLVNAKVTLNGKPAKISGNKNRFATVSVLPDGESHEWSWAAVANVVKNKGGKFTSGTKEEADETSSPDGTIDEKVAENSNIGKALGKEIVDAFKKENLIADIGDEYINIRRKDALNCEFYGQQGEDYAFAHATYEVDGKERELDFTLPEDLGEFVATVKKILTGPLPSGGKDVEEEANVAKNVSPEILAALTKEWEGATGGDKELPDDSAVKMRGGYVEHYWNDGEILRKDVYHVSNDGSLSLEDSFYRYDAGDKWQTTNQFESIETVVLSEDADASMAPPKKWFDKMYQGVHKSDPKYDDAKIRATVGNIWYHELSDKKRKAIRGKEKKKAPAKNIKKESVDALDFIESILVENEIPSTRQRLDKLIHQRADLSDKQIDAGEGEVFDTEIQKLKLELDKETLPEASKDMPKITGLIPAKNTVEVSHNGKLYYYKPKHGQISHLKVGDTIATGMLGHGFTQTTESEEVTETQKLLPVGTKVKLLGRHKKGEKTTFTGKTGTISGHHKVVGLGDAYKVKVGNETVDQVHPSAVERDSIKESENISEAFYGIDSDDEDDTKKTEAFIKKYPELAKQVQKVGDGYKLTPEAEKELKRTYDLFTSNETAHERMEGTEAKIIKEVERVIKKARPEFASKFKIAVDFHTQDSYVGDDAGSATITLTLGDQEEEFEPSALYYNGAHDAAQDALLPSGWDWATWFMDDESPLYSDSFSEAYEYDQITQALEQFSSTLDESDFDSDLIKKLGEFNYDEEEQDESVDEAYPDTAAFSDLQDNSLAEEDPENDEETGEDEPQEDDAFMTPTGRLGARTSLSYSGKHVGDFDEQDEAEQALAELMKKSKFWPNVWFVDDHGGQHLISKDFYKQYKTESEVTEGKWDVDITFEDVKAHVDDWMDSYVEGKPPLRIGGLGPKVQKQVVSYMKQHGYPASDVDFSGGTTGFGESDNDFKPTMDPMDEGGVEESKSAIFSKVKAFEKEINSALEKAGVSTPDGDPIKVTHLQYDKAMSQKESDGKTYHYPEMVSFNIESRDTMKFSMLSDGKLIREGTDLSGPGVPKEEVIQDVIDNVKEWSDFVNARKNQKEDLGQIDQMDEKKEGRWMRLVNLDQPDVLKFLSRTPSGSAPKVGKLRLDQLKDIKNKQGKVWMSSSIGRGAIVHKSPDDDYAYELPFFALLPLKKEEAVKKTDDENSDSELHKELMKTGGAGGRVTARYNSLLRDKNLKHRKEHPSLYNKKGKFDPFRNEVTEAASTDMHKDLAATLLADTFMNEIEENYPALQREIAGPGQDIVDGMKMAAEEYGLNLDEYLPVKLVKSIEADANKKWAGKLTLKELYAHDENAAHRLMLMAVGHGVAPDDDHEIAEWLKGKGVDVHDLGHYENDHDTGAALADAMAEAKNIGRNEDMKPSFDPLKEKDEKEREHDDETDVNDGNIVKNDSEIR